MRSERKKLYGLVVLCLMLVFTVSCSSKKTLVVLLPEDNNPSSAVTIGQGDWMTVIDQPMTSARVGSRGRVKKEVVTSAEVEQDFAQALAAQPPEPISFTLYFEEGSTVVLPESRNILKALFVEVAKRQAVEVQVTGHTDTVGRETENDSLSVERAEAIKDMLVEKGLQANFVRAVGRGERELLILTPDNFREPKNRRVEVIVR